MKNYEINWSAYDSNIIGNYADVLARFMSMDDRETISKLEVATIFDMEITEEK